VTVVSDDGETVTGTYIVRVALSPSRTEADPTLTTGSAEDAADA
jgi:hypothetical protein